MKHLLNKTKSPLVRCVAIAMLALIGFSAPAQNNDERTLTTGISWIGAGGTSNALSTAWLDVKNHEEVAVQWRMICSNTNITGAGNVLTATFGGSEVPSNFVAIATVTSAINNTATTTKEVGTNIYVGSFRYFGLINIANGGTNTTATNTSPTGVAGQIKLQFKNNRNGT